MRSPSLLALCILTGCGAPQVLHAQPDAGARPLRITREMVMNEIVEGDAFALFDEQDSPEPKTPWFEGWGRDVRPLRAWIDLGRPHKISKIALYDSNGAGAVRVFTGRPFAWKLAFEDGLDKYNSWSEHAMEAEAQFVRVEIPKGAGNFTEVKIYGTPTDKAPVVPPQVLGARPVARAPRVTMERFVGMNGFIDDPIEVLAAGGWVREYHSWAWDEGDGAANAATFPNNQNKFAPSYAANGGWSFDDYYAKLRAAGVEPAPVMQGSVSWLSGDAKRDARAHAPGADAENPKSYAAHADHMFQFAARYGSRKVADNLLKLAPDQPRLSGLGHIKYFENWNEADRTWAGREEYFSPYEYASMSSADRDGHAGAMGKTVGILNADPNAKLVMTGLARSPRRALEYVRVMKAWSDWNRPDLRGVNGGFVCDAINLHHYSTNGEEQTEGSVGVSPEADEFKKMVREVVDYRDKYLPGVEIWVTEFGYDTNPASPFRAPVVGPHDHEEVQAQWMIRSYLELAAAGVDRAAMFMSRDVNAKDTTKFSSSGLTTEKGAWKPKPSWFYVSTLKSRLAGMSFQREVDTKRADVSASLFSNTKLKQNVVAVWCPTSEGKAVDKYLLPLPAGTKKATLIEMKAGEARGIERPLVIRGGAVEVVVSERPVFVTCS